MHLWPTRASVSSSRSGAPPLRSAARPRRAPTTPGASGAPRRRCGKSGTCQFPPSRAALQPGPAAAPRVGGAAAGCAPEAHSHDGAAGGSLPRHGLDGPPAPLQRGGKASDARDGGTRPASHPPISTSNRRATGGRASTIKIKPAHRVRGEDVNHEAPAAVLRPRRHEDFGVLAVPVARAPAGPPGRVVTAEWELAQEGQPQPAHDGVEDDDKPEPSCPAW